MIGYSFICLLVFAVTYTEKEIDLCGLHGVVIRLIPARLKCDRGRVFLFFCLFVCLAGWLAVCLLLIGWLVGYVMLFLRGSTLLFFIFFFFMAW